MLVLGALAVALACTSAGPAAAAAPRAAKAAPKGKAAKPAPRRRIAKPRPKWPRVVRSGRIKIWTIYYRAHSGDRVAAHVLLPAWYGPRRNPPLPLVISPHGRGVSGRGNARLWGQLPARGGGFAVVNPDGHGRRLPFHSWGYSGQIDDLARMPQIVELALPWLRIDRTQVFAFGGSMGGQETLLLLARHPRLLAGAAVFDAVADLAMQYRRFDRLHCNARCRHRQAEPLGLGLRKLARNEIGGQPKSVPVAYRVRSPITYARALAFSCVPLQMWWSVSDRIVTNQQEQSGKLFWLLRRLNPYAPVQGFAGFWIHSAAMRAKTGLPHALAAFGLLPQPEGPPDVPGVRAVPPPAESPGCTTTP